MQHIFTKGKLQRNPQHGKPQSDRGKITIFSGARIGFYTSRGGLRSRGLSLRLSFGSGGF